MVIERYYQKFVVYRIYVHIYLFLCVCVSAVRMSKKGTGEQSFSKIEYFGKTDNEIMNKESKVTVKFCSDPFWLMNQWNRSYLISYDRYSLTLFCGSFKTSLLCLFFLLILIDLIENHRTMIWTWCLFVYKIVKEGNKSPRRCIVSLSRSGLKLTVRGHDLTKNIRHHYYCKQHCFYDLS